MIINPYRFASGGAFDPDAQAFFTASGLTGTTNLNAINQLVVDLKTYGIWTKMKAIYPFVGGTAALHKWNLKDPQDTNAAFRLVFSGGWTHSATGALPNGTNGWANTFFNLSLNSTVTDISAGVYNRTNTLNISTVTFGAETGANLFAGTVLVLKSTDQNTYYGVNDNLGQGPFLTLTDVRGFFTQTYIASNGTKGFYKNGIQISNSIRNNPTAPNLQIAFGANNRAGIIQFYDSRESSFLFFGNTLTNAEILNFYTAVQAYQTSLARQV